jgi:hypothetical protein
MITYQAPPRIWQGTWALTLLLGAGAGAGVWWWQALDAPRAGVQAAQVAPEPVAQPAPKPSKPLQPMSEVALLVPPKVLADGRPADFSPEDWAALQDAVSRSPTPRAELERVVKYVRFQKAFERWQSLQDSPDNLSRRYLAQKLLDEVPERLKQGEVTYGEAMLLMSALVADIEPDETVRQQRLEKLQAVLTEAAPQAEPGQSARDASLLAEYKRREAAVVAAYQSLPEARRDPAQLSRDLDAVRISVYGTQK